MHNSQRHNSSVIGNTRKGSNKMKALYGLVLFLIPLSVTADERSKEECAKTFFFAEASIMNNNSFIGSITAPLIDVIHNKMYSQIPNSKSIVQEEMHAYMLENYQSMPYLAGWLQRYSRDQMCSIADIFERFIANPGIVGEQPAPPEIVKVYSEIKKDEAAKEATVEWFKTVVPEINQRVVERLRVEGFIRRNGGRHAG